MTAAHMRDAEACNVDVRSILSESEMQALVAQHGRATRPEPPYPILFSVSLLIQATVHLQANGRIQHEQLVLWGGYAAPQGVLLTSLLLPETEATWDWCTRSARRAAKDHHLAP